MSRSTHYADGAIDTRYALWEQPYLCNLPLIQMITMEELELFGMPSCGIPEYDKAMAHDMRTVMIPIVEMAEYFDRGVQIHLVQYEDTKKIYDAIQAHLIAWKNHLERSLNVFDAPLEDLLLLDRFANTVYEYAKWQFSHTAPQSLRGLMGSRSIGALLSKAVVTIEQGDRNEREGKPRSWREASRQDDGPQIAPRQSFEHVFSQGRAPSRFTPPTASSPMGGGLPSLNDSTAPQASFADLLTGRKSWKG